MEEREKGEPRHLEYSDPFRSPTELMGTVKGGGIVDHCGGRKVYHLA